jgi:hypothetical protein
MNEHVRRTSAMVQNQASQLRFGPEEKGVISLSYYHISQEAQHMIPMSQKELAMDVILGHLRCGLADV